MAEKKKGYPKDFSYEDENPSRDEISRRIGMEQQAMKAARNAERPQASKEAREIEDWNDSAFFGGPSTVDEFVARKNQRKALRDSGIYEELATGRIAARKEYDEKLADRVKYKRGK